jgi:hypothetical protein
VPNLALVALVLALAAWWLLERSLYGRRVLAIGQNIRAARFAGVPVDGVRLATYTLSAVLAALCGFLLSCFSGGAALNMGAEYLLMSIAVVVIGGTSVAGGNSNVPGIWGASLFMFLVVSMLNTYGLGAGLPADPDRADHHRRDPGRHADEHFEVRDERFRMLAMGNVHVERLWTGCRWAEGPAWFGAGRYLVWSDIPNDRMMRYDDTDGSVSVFRQPSWNSNGNTLDREGRLVSCEHSPAACRAPSIDGTRDRAGIDRTRASGSTRPTTWW